MRVDRHRFLALTAALAACNAQAPVAAPGGVIEIPSTAPPAPPAPTNASGASDAGSAPVAAKSEVDESAAVELEPIDACTTTNASGTPADCTKLRRPPGPHCESFDDTIDECKEMTRLLRPAVAEKATKCMLAKSAAGTICQFGVAGLCAGQAFRASCADPSTVDDCKAIVKKCAKYPVETVPRVTVAECQGALGAVAAKNRPAMLSCMSEGCTSGYCFSYLK